MPVASYKPFESLVFFFAFVFFLSQGSNIEQMQLFRILYAA